MKKITKFFASLLAAIIFILILIGVLLAIFVNPNQIKTQLNNLVYQKTHHELVINGKVGWTIYPLIGLRIHDVSLKNTAEFNTNQPLAHADTLYASIKLRPLLHKEFQLNKIVLKGLTLNLVKNAAGEVNWKNLLTPPQTQNPPSPAPTNSSPSTSQPTYPTISDVTVNHANIIYNNQQNGSTHQINNLQLRARRVNFEHAFPINLSFDFASNKHTLAATLLLTSQLKLQLAAKQYNLDNIKMHGAFWNQNTPTRKMPFDLGANAALDLKQQLLHINNLNLTNKDLDIKGQIQGSQITNNPLFQGNFRIAKMNLKQLLEILGHPLHVSGLERIKLSTRFEASPQFLKLQNLNGVVDESNVAGSFTINDFSKPTINFDLNTNYINLNHYLRTSVASYSPSSFQAYAAPRTAAATGNSSSTVQGHLHADRLIISNYNLSNVNTQINANKGIIKLSPFTAGIYQGSMSGEIIIDSRSGSPAYIINQRFSGIPLSAVIKTDKISGTSFINARISMRGRSNVDFKSSLNGSVDFTVSNVVLQGIDIPYQLQRAYSFVVKLPLPGGPTDTKMTSFGQLTGAGTFQNGVFYNSNLDMESSVIHVSGSGTADLNTETLNYRFVAGKLNTSAGIPLLQPEQPPIPFTVTGSFSHPTITPDMQAILKSQITKRLRSILPPTSPEELKERIREGVIFRRFLK